MAGWPVTVACGPVVVLGAPARVGVDSTGAGALVEAMAALEDSPVFLPFLLQQRQFATVGGFDLLF